MAVIGTIRTRFLWIMLVLIGVSMFLFLIMSEWESGAAILRGNKNSLGSIDGTTLDRVAFEDKVKENEDNLLLNKEGQTSLSEQERQGVREQTWKELLNKTVMDKLFAKNGIQVTVDEQIELLRGDLFPDPMIRQNFTDPNTGMYSGQTVVNFVNSLNQKDGGPEIAKRKRQWDAFKKYIIDNRTTTKYTALVTKGIYSPKWMNEMVYDEFTSSADGKVLQVPYSSIPDANVKVTDDDLKAYLNAHQKKYESKEESRRIKFAMFQVVPSTFDSMEVKKWMDEKFAELKTTDNDTTFINVNSETQFNLSWTRKTEFTGAYADSIFNAPEGSYVGPYYDGMVYKVAKITNKKVLSDSVQYSQIVLTINSDAEVQAKVKLFDSLFRVLDTLGGDMAALANAYSDDPANSIQVGPNQAMKMGGAKGWATKATVPANLAYFLFDNDNGRYMKTQDNNKIYILKVTQTKPTVPAVKVSYLAKTIIPSKETEDGILSRVSKFASDNQNAKTFEASIKKMPPTSSREFSINKNDHNVPGIGMARSMVKWVFENEKGKVSPQPFRVDNQYLVVLVDNIKPEGLPSIDAVREELKVEVIKEKKIEMITKKINDAKATSIEALAPKVNATYIPVTGVSMAQGQVGTFGFEPAVAGAFLGAPKGKITAPIPGLQGVYVLVCDKITKTPAKSPAETMQAGNYFIQNLTRSLSQGLTQSVVDNVKLVDNRFNFY